MSPHRTRRLTLDGNHLLYHFLQKTLLESDAEQFRQLASQLIAALGIWLSPDGKRLTVTTTGNNGSGRAGTDMAVYEKQ